MEGIAGGQSVFELIDNEPQEEVSVRTKKMDKLTNEIKIDNVSFEYDSIPVLKNINIKIKCGSVTTSPSIVMTAMLFYIFVKPILIRILFTSHKHHMFKKMSKTLQIVGV